MSPEAAADDYRHMALIAQAARTPIQIGENFAGLPPMAAALEAGATTSCSISIASVA
jgi:hypothetical protein